MNLNLIEALINLYAYEKKELSRKLTKKDVATILLGMAILLLLLFLLDRIPALKEFINTYPILGRLLFPLVPYLFLFIIIMGALAFVFGKSPKCPVCNCKYNNFKLSFCQMNTLKPVNNLCLF